MDGMNPSYLGGGGTTFGGPDDAHLMKNINDPHPSTATTMA